MTLVISFDVETDGKSPATSNMIQFGAVAYLFNKKNMQFKEVDSICVDIAPRKGYPGHPDNIKLWNMPDRIKLYEEMIKGRQFDEAMELIDSFLKNIREKYYNFEELWISRLAAYDMQWINYYNDLYCSTHKSAIRISSKAICVSSIRDTYILHKGLTKDEYGKLEKEWTLSIKFTHSGLYYARCQALKYFNLLKSF